MTASGNLEAGSFCPPRSPLKNDTCISWSYPSRQHGNKYISLTFEHCQVISIEWLQQLKTLASWGYVNLLVSVRREDKLADKRLRLSLPTGKWWVNIKFQFRWSSQHLYGNFTARTSWAGGVQSRGNTQCMYLRVVVNFLKGQMEKIGAESYTW